MQPLAEVVKKVWHLVDIASSFAPSTSSRRWYELFAAVKDKQMESDAVDADTSKVIYNPTFNRENKHLKLVRENV